MRVQDVHWPLSGHGGSSMGLEVISEGGQQGGRGRWLGADADWMGGWWKNGENRSEFVKNLLADRTIRTGLLGEVPGAHGQLVEFGMKYSEFVSTGRTVIDDRYGGSWIFVVLLW